MHQQRISTISRSSNPVHAEDRHQLRAIPLIHVHRGGVRRPQAQAGEVVSCYEVNSVDLTCLLIT